MFKYSATLLLLCFLAFNSYASPARRMKSVTTCPDITSNPQFSGGSLGFVKPIKDFDRNKVLNTRWYQVMYADNYGPAPDDCMVIEFNQFCSKDRSVYYFQQGWLEQPNDEGQRDTWINTILFGDWINNIDAEFMLTSFSTASLAVVVDRAKNYDWFIIFYVDTFEDYYFGMEVLSKTPNNQAAKARGLQLIEQYGLKYKVENLHGSQCNYKVISDKMKLFR